jgi:nucleotide-binding universal stress UspA family protein
VATLRQRLRERTEREAAHLEAERRRSERAGIECSASIADGRPYETILSEATRQCADLIVVGPHAKGAAPVRRGAVAERLLGTTADRVVRHAPCPVLVAPVEEHGAPPIRGGHWVVGVDFSETARHAVRVAKDLASASGGRLTLVLVEQPVGISEGVDLKSGGQQFLRDELAELAAAECGGTSVQLEVVFGHGADELCRVASSEKASVLVVGPHGRTGLGHVLLGSTAERCLRRATIPVLVTRRTSAKHP